MITANDNTTITQMGSFIHVSNGETYTLTGRTLSGPNGVVSWNCGSIEEAVGTVVGLYGGRKF